MAQPWTTYHRHYGEVSLFDPLDFRSTRLAVRTRSPGSVVVRGPVSASLLGSEQLPFIEGPFILYLAFVNVGCPRGFMESSGQEPILEMEENISQMSWRKLLVRCSARHCERHPVSTQTSGKCWVLGRQWTLATRPPSQAVTGPSAHHSSELALQQEDLLTVSRALETRGAVCTPASGPVAGRTQWRGAGLGQGCLTCFLAQSQGWDLGSRCIF